MPICSASTPLTNRLHRCVVQPGLGIRFREAEARAEAGHERFGDGSLSPPPGAAFFLSGTLEASLFSPPVALGLVGLLAALGALILALFLVCHLV